VKGFFSLGLKACFNSHKTKKEKANEVGKGRVLCRDHPFGRFRGKADKTIPSGSLKPSTEVGGFLVS
jgi:hypothetical protein